MKIINIIIAFFILTSAILFSSVLFAALTQCPDNPSTASPSDWVITQPLPTSSGYFSLAEVGPQNRVYCYYSPKQGYFGFLYTTMGISKVNNPQYWTNKNCQYGGPCCTKSPELCTFTE